MRKPAFYKFENKWAVLWENQRFAYAKNKDADQCLCFRYLDSTIHFLSKYKIFKPLAISSGCTAWFVSDLVRIHIVGFLISRLKCKPCPADQYLSLLASSHPKCLFSMIGAGNLKTDFVVARLILSRQQATKVLIRLSRYAADQHLLLFAYSKSRFSQEAFRCIPFW